MADNNLTTKEEFLLNPVEEHNITDAAVASFETNLKHPLKVTVPITPVQDLHGMPYPYPAGASVNLIPDGMDTENGYIADYYLASDGTTVSNTSWYVSEFFPVDESTTYTWSNSGGPSASDVPSIAFYDENKEFISGIATGQQRSHTFTPPSGAVYARSSQSKYTSTTSNKMQLEVGSTATEYRRYSNICPISYYTASAITGTNSNVFGGTVLGAALKTLSGASYGSDENGRYVKQNGYKDGTRYFFKDFKENTQYTFLFKMRAEGSTSVWRYYVDYTDGSNDYAFSPTTLGYYRFVSDAGKTVKAIRNRKITQNNCYIYYDESGIFEGNVNVNAFQAYKGNTIPITFTDPSTGDPMTVYGGSLTLNEDGSADLVNKYISKIETGNGVSLYSGARMRVTTPGFSSPGPSTIADVKANYLSTKTKASMGGNFWEISASDSGRAEVLIKLTSTINTVELVKEYLAENPLQIVYKLATPRTYHFPNVGQLKAFLGQNNVWSDIGNVNVKYLTQHSETGLEYRGDRALELRRRAMMADAPTIHTTIGSEETGGLASFNSYVKAPVKKIEIPFSPKQDLHGYDHPWPGGASINLFNPDATLDSKRTDNVGVVINYNNYCVSDWIPVTENTNYYTNKSISSSYGYGMCFYNENKQFLRYYTISGGGSMIKNSGANAAYLRVTVPLSTKTSTIVAQSDTAVSFIPYANICPIEGYNQCVAKQIKLPPGYTAVDYIRLKNILRVDTEGIVDWDSYYLGLGVEFFKHSTKLYGSIVSAYVNEDTNATRLIIGTGGNGYYITNNYKAGASKAITIPDGFNDICIWYNTYILNGKRTVISSLTGGNKNTATRLFFGYEDCNIDYRWAYVLDSTNPHRYLMCFVPCVDKYGIAGFYDVINDNFHTTDNPEDIEAYGVLQKPRYTFITLYDDDYKVSNSFIKLPIVFNQEGDHTFLPIQEGTGTPSPENVRPIHQGLTFTRDDDSVLSIWGGTLTVNADGTGNLASELGIFTSNNSTGWTVFGSGGFFYENALNTNVLTGTAEAPFRCNKYELATAVPKSTYVDDRADNTYFTQTNYPKRLWIKDTSLDATLESLNASLTATPLQVSYPLTEPVTYTLSVTETNRALEALGLTQHIGPLYGGTITINPDGSADVVSDRIVLTKDHLLSLLRNYKQGIEIAKVTVWGESTTGVSRLCALRFNIHNTFFMVRTDSVVANCLKTYHQGNWQVDSTRNAWGIETYVNGQTMITAPYGELPTIDDWIDWLDNSDLFVVGRAISGYEQTYHFSNLEQLKVWLGENNFWCDISDDITVKYWNRG